MWGTCGLIGQAYPNKPNWKTEQFTFQFWRRCISCEWWKWNLVDDLFQWNPQWQERSLKCITNGGVDQVWDQYKLHAVGWLLPLADKLSLEPRTVPCWRHTPLWKFFSRELLLHVMISYKLNVNVTALICWFLMLLLHQQVGLKPLGRCQNCSAKVKGHSTWCIISKLYLFDVRGNCFQLLDEELSYCQGVYMAIDKGPPCMCDAFYLCNVTTSTIGRSHECLATYTCSSVSVRVIL